LLWNCQTAIMIWLACSGTVKLQSWYEWLVRFIWNQVQWGRTPYFKLTITLLLKNHKSKNHQYISWKISS